MTEQRLANQTRVIRANGSLSEVTVDEIQSKIREYIRAKNWTAINLCDQQRSQDEDDVEWTNFENLFNTIKDQGLINDAIRLVEEVAQQMKTDKTLSNLRNVERKQLKSKSTEINRILNFIVAENITPKKIGYWRLLVV